MTADFNEENQFNKLTLIYHVSHKAKCLFKLIRFLCSDRKFILKLAVHTTLFFGSTMTDCEWTQSRRPYFH